MRIDYTSHLERRPTGFVKRLEFEILSDNGDIKDCFALAKDYEEVLSRIWTMKKWGIKFNVTSLQSIFI